MNISDEIKDVLLEMINTGVGHAASSFSDMVNKEVNLSVPILHIFNWEEMKKYLEEQEPLKCINITQSFKGGLTGRGIVSFPMEKGKTLVNTLMEISQSDLQVDFGVMEKETIIEVGNVILNAIAFTISNMAEIETYCEIPQIIFADQIIDLNKESFNNMYFVGHADFYVKEIEIEGKILFVLAYSNIEKLVKKILEQ